MLDLNLSASCVVVGKRRRASHSQAEKNIEENEEGGGSECKAGRGNCCAAIALRSHPV